MSITKRDIQASIVKLKMKRHCEDSNMILRDMLKSLHLHQTIWMAILKGKSTSLKNIVTLVNEIKYFTYEDFVKLLKEEDDE